MSQLDTGMATVQTTKRTSNIYTVLMLVAVVVLGVGVGVVAWKNLEMTREGLPAAGSRAALPDGGNNPFFLLPAVSQ